MDDKLTDAEMAMLEACRSHGDWRRACDAVKNARKGLYPADWWARVVQSGVAERILSPIGLDTKLRAEVQRPDGSWTPLR